MTESLATTSGPIGSAGTIDLPETGTSSRPRYERPRITFQETLEVMAVVCTPGKTNLGNCSRGPISS
jgi:hypothetical protein